MAGTEIYTYQVSRELSRRGNDVYVLYPVFAKNSFIYFVNKRFRKKLKLYEIFMPFTRRIEKQMRLTHSYFDKVVEELFGKVIDEIKPDVIQFQHLMFLSINLLKIAREKGIPTFLTLHDYWFICPRTQFLKYDYIPCVKRDGNCLLCWINGESERLVEYLSQYPFLLFERIYKKLLKILLLKLNNKVNVKGLKLLLKKYLIKYVDILIAPSNFSRNVFIKCGIPQDKIICSDNGYNLESPSKIDIDKMRKKQRNKIILGFIGSSFRHKGIDVLIEAFNKLNSRNSELRLYGKLKYRYKELRRKCKGNDNIKFMGEFKDVRTPLSEIDMLVIPSIWWETSSLVIKEAFLSKTPVIASKIGALPEFVEDGKNGILFEPRNIKNLTEKMNEISSSPYIIDKFRTHISAPRSIKAQVDELLAIYGNSVNDTK